MSESEKHLEEERRERHWDPRRRWLAIQETITWAEAQATVARNTMGACLARQSEFSVSAGAANGSALDDTARSITPLRETATPSARRHGSP
ncbi:MAG: hypothetical protein HZA91_11365 [Verrucomicrobia bacterium]|nr:hypothetical protein [Verrucomicrobiota bacterium]